MLPTRAPERRPVGDPVTLERPGAGADTGFRWPADRPRRPAPRPRPRPPRTWQSMVRTAILAVGLTAAGLVYLLPSHDGLPVKGKIAFSIFLACTTLWVTNALPVGITGLMAVALLGLSGAMAPAEAFAAFGSSAVFFILGVFILAAAIIRSGLSKRIALQFLVRFGRSPYALATGMMLIAALLTVFMPAQATVAMLFPIAFELARALRLRAGASEYGKVLFLSLAWGAMVGSNASFLGSTRAPLALGLLSHRYGISISFWQWLQAAFPVVLLGMLATPLLLRFAFPRERVDPTAARDALERAVEQLGRMGAPQIKVAGVMMLTIAAWVLLGGRRVDFAIIAILGAAAMFVLRVLKWEDLEGYIHWSVVLMYGGAIALGVAIDKSGVAHWLAHTVIGDVRVPSYVAAVGLAVSTLVLSEFMSNAAAVAVMLPLGFSLASQLGASPTALVLSASIGAGLAFTLPISSAPNTIAFASGYLRMTDFVRVGTIMTLLSIAILLLVARFWWPLVGVL
ncbi:MAG TPA: DASS family sodium-coupled anion symporter [Gemmatimonadaceae bacterium]|nr:DASS family sodium-coupled anion symporter [Gemmatimonadaceae bacterium]